MVVVLVLSDDVKKRSVGFKKAMVRMIIAMVFDLMGLVDRVICEGGSVHIHGAGGFHCSNKRSASRTLSWMKR